MAGKSKWVEPVVSLLRAQGQAYSGDICRKLNMKREQFARAVRSSQGRIVEAFPGSRIYKLKEPNDVLDELRRESKPLPGWSSVIHLPPKLHERYVGPDLARFKENQQVRWRGEDPAAHGADFYDMHSDYWPPEFDQLARALEDAREWFTRYARKLVYQSLMAEKQTKRDRKTVDVEINGRHYRVRGSVEGAAAAEVDRLMHGVVIELSLVPMALLEQDRSMKAAIDRLRNQDADRFNAITRKFLIK